MMLDAAHHHHLPLTEERLFGWHTALFPTGYSGLYKIEVAKYRTGAMQVVSGPLGQEKVHYEALAPELVSAEMSKFLEWFNNEQQLDLVLKAAIAHFWFIIIHPFDDGNGRIARALTYRVLQRVQHSSGNITEWIDWFLQCQRKAMLVTEQASQGILRKAEFWKLHEQTPINERQLLMIRPTPPYATSKI